ncbi:zf-HC2 domain-containing protein [Streptomyces melanogenes]|uniref:Zf-HC2 domain-containing protein n=1 Tax=Streptomyces melanogenes TaxID=67326 RepID=A0ABZ1XUF0_9ACTN|nr:zf-HC2 domain-containing protein [Streptomyces melanogenes]
MRPLELHRDVGAYALGVLGVAETFRFEEHLAGCAHCARLLEELGSVEALLAAYARWTPPGVDPVAVPSPGLLHSALGAVGARLRVRRRRRLGLLVAAAALVVGAPFAALDLMADPVAPHWTATASAPGVTATLAAAPAGFGTDVGLDVGGVRGPAVCTLVAVGRGGEEDTVATWAVRDADQVTMRGAAALAPADISRFEVRTREGARLATLTRSG